MEITQGQALSNKEYNKIEAMRVSEIVKFATQDIETIIQKSLTQDTYTQNIITGLAYHAYVLRKDRSSMPSDIIEIQFPDYRKKEAQEAKAKALAVGKIPLLTHEIEKIEKTLIKMMPTLDEFFDTDTCEFEQSYIDDDVTFGKVKGRVDAIKNNELVLDLKVSTNTLFLDKKIFDMGYQLQMFLYMSLVGVENAKLVFFNPDSYFIKTKSLNINTIRDECIALLKRAKKNMMLFESWQKGEYNYENEGEYQVPQWALHYLINSDKDSY